MHRLKSTNSLSMSSRQLHQCVLHRLITTTSKVASKLIMGHHNVEEVALKDHVDTEDVDHSSADHNNVDQDHTVQDVVEAISVGHVGSDDLNSITMDIEISKALTQL